MRLVSIDTETYPLGFLYPEGKKTHKCNVNSVPRLVCMSYSEDGKTAKVVTRLDALRLFRTWILDPSVKLVGANIAYEMLAISRASLEEHGDDLLTEIFAAYDADRVHDVQIREQLIDIATNDLDPRGYSLVNLEKRYLDLDRSGLKKGDDVWRLRYNELDGVPVEEWPDGARSYAEDDAITPWLIYHEQNRLTYSTLGTCVASSDGVVNEAFQVRADLATSLISAWGLRIDREYAQGLDEEWKSIEDDAAIRLKRFGLMRENGVKNTKEIQRLFATAAGEAGIAPLRTKGDGIATSDDALQAILDTGYLEIADAFSDDPNDGPTIRKFKALAQHQKATKFRSNYLEPLLLAAPYAICPYFNILVATGRTSSSKPNIQNFPGYGRGAKIRECFVPRDGYLYINVDYDAAEMKTLAQVNINNGVRRVHMAEAIRDGIDLHLDFAAQLLGLPYADALAIYKDDTHPLNERVDLNRKISKAANFGYPGGMGGKAFPSYAAGYGVRVTVQEGYQYKAQWLNRWEEMREYFEFVSAHQKPDGSVPIKQHGPAGNVGAWRVRNCDRYTAACNTLFQGLAADGVKLAMWNLAKACYADRDHVLYGCRPVTFVHDEVMLEAPAWKASLCADAMTKIMCDALGVFVPDLPITAEPAIAARWYKSMKSTRNKESGEWSIYAPKAAS